MTQKKNPAQGVVKTTSALPTLNDLIAGATSREENQLTYLLNQEPPAAWIKDQQGVKYLPIDKVEFMLTKIFGGFKVEVMDVQLIVNSVMVRVRVHVRNPLTGEQMWQDGVGAWPIQVDSGCKASDITAIKSRGVMMAAPAAESLAVKDAAEKWGKIFGRDVAKKESTAYDSILRIDKLMLMDLYEQVKEALTDEDKTRCEQVIADNEEVSFGKMYKFLMQRGGGK
jgi:hypothetical protein